MIQVFMDMLNKKYMLGILVIQLFTNEKQRHQERKDVKEVRW